MSGSSKQAIEGAQRGALLLVDPWKLFLVGRDTRPDGRVDGPEHPLYDERALEPPDPAMVASMIAVGFFTVVTFRNNGSLSEIIWGRRRVTAAREAARQLAEVGAPPFLIGAVHKRGTDATVLEVSNAENELRRGDPPLLRAKKAQRMLDRGAPESTVCRAFGITPAALRQTLKLLDLSDGVQAAVEAGEMSASAALPLAVLSRQEQDKTLAAAKEPGKKSTRRKVEKALDFVIPRPKADTSRRKLSRADFRHLGTCEFPQGAVDGFDAHDFGLLQSAFRLAGREDLAAVEDGGAYDSTLDALVEAMLASPRCMRSEEAVGE